MSLVTPTKKLILHIEIPGLWVDDLSENAAEFECEIMDLLLEEVMRPEVGLTIVTIPGDKCMNDDFQVHAYTCRVVGAEVVDIDGIVLGDPAAAHEATP